MRTLKLCCVVRCYYAYATPAQWELFYEGYCICGQLRLLCHTSFISLDIETSEDDQGRPMRYKLVLSSECSSGVYRDIKLFIHYILGG